MKSSEWKDVFEDLIDGVELELGRSARTKARVTLNAFRKRLNEARSTKTRKRFKRELDAFLQSEPFLTAATRRYLHKKAIPLIEAAVAALSRAARVLAKYKNKQRLAKMRRSLDRDITRAASRKLHLRAKR